VFSRLVGNLSCDAGELDDCLREHTAYKHDVTAGDSPSVTKLVVVHARYED
jgi:hypothetical protein